MSNECGGNGEIIRTYLIDDYSIVTGCTIVVDEISSCSPSGITINNDVFVNGSLYSLIFSGGTFYGDGSNLSGISTDNFYVTGGTFNDISKTLTLFRNDGNSVLITGFTDYFVTGGTYSNGTLTLDRQNGSVSISGFLSADTYVTGFTFNTGTYDLTILQNNGLPSLTQNLGILAGDITVTGGTYNPSNGVATFYNNAGGSFQVPGFLTGFTDIYVTSGTYNPNNGNLTLTRTDSVNVVVTGFTDYYITGGTYSNGTLTLNRQNGSVNISGLKFTGNTSGDCITDLYVQNLNSCSPLHIQPTNTGNVYIGENGGVNVGIGTSSTTAQLTVKGSGTTITTKTASFKDGNGVEFFKLTDDRTFDYNGIAKGEGSTNSFTSIIPLSSPATWYSGVYVNTTNLEPSAYFKGFWSNVTGSNGIAGTFTNNSAGISTYLSNWSGWGVETTGGIFVNGDKLYLKGDGTGATSNTEIVNSSSNPLLYVLNNGNVGIGTSSPTEKLEVNGKTKTTTLQITSGSTAGYVLTALDSNGNTYWAPSFSGTTDTDNYVTGGTYSNGTLTLERQNGFVSITGFSQYFISGSTPTGTTINYGDRWYNTNNGIELVYITDGNSDQWVQPLSTPGPPGPPGYSSLMVTSGITASTATLNINVNYYGVVHNSNVDISLPNPSGYDGYNINIKDESGNANIYRIRLTPLSGLIDGNNYVDMNTNYMSLHIIARNNNWWII